MTGKRILVVDGNAARRGETAQKLSRAFEVFTAEDGQQAIGRIEADGPDLVLCAHDVAGHGPKALSDYLHEFVSGHVRLVLLLEGGEAEAERLRRETGADAVMPFGLGEAQLVPVCKVLLESSVLRSQLDHLQEENAGLRKASAENQVFDPGTRFYRFDVFKHVIAMEVKKAKRYGYPLALLMINIDRYAEMAGWLTPEGRRTLFEALHREISASVRDIDIPLLFAVDKVLVVMPHTTLSGAATVADRIRTRAASLKPPGSLAQLKLSLSLSVSSTERIGEVSFAKLIQDTVRGLKEAELKGGDVVIVCRAPDETGDTSACQDGGGQLGPRTFFV